MLNKALGKKGCLFEHPFKSDHRHPVCISMLFRLFALTLSLPPSHPHSLSVSLLSHCLSLPLSLSLFSLCLLSIFAFLSRSLSRSLALSLPLPPYVCMCVRAFVYIKLTAMRYADMYLEAWTLRSYSQCTTATNTKTFNQTPKQTNYISASGELPSLSKSWSLSSAKCSCPRHYSEEQDHSPWPSQTKEAAACPHERLSSHIKEASITVQCAAMFCVSQLFSFLHRGPSYLFPLSNGLMSQLQQRNAMHLCMHVGQNNDQFESSLSEE